MLEHSFFIPNEKPAAIKSTQLSTSYKLSSQSTCQSGGIYCLTCKYCSAQYTGKTATTFKLRHSQHFQKSQKSALKVHMNDCQASSKEDFDFVMLQNVHDRGKYSLSEQEYLWNKRIQGTINIQKTIMEN